MRTWIAVAAAVATLVAREARADTPEPQSYWIHQDAGRVTVSLTSYSERTCPDQGLLRLDVDSGEIVAITTCEDTATFVDECVPAGRYQYGLAVPYECAGAAETDWFSEVTVSPGAPAECSRAVDDPVAASSVPWSDSSVRCRGSYHGPGGCNTGSAVLGGNLAVLLAGAFLWRRRARRRADA